MPIYVYFCDKHGSFDEFCHYEYRDIEKPCPYKLTGGSDNSLDSEPYICGSLSERIPHRVSMQPDTLWPGAVDAQLGRYFTRTTQRKEFMRNRELNGVGEIYETMSTDKFDRPSAEQEAERKFNTAENNEERERCFREAIKEVEEKRGTTMEKALKQEAKERRIRGET